MNNFTNVLYYKEGKECGYGVYGIPGYEFLNNFTNVLYYKEGKECGYGVYGIPGYGDLNYCGLAGLFPLLRKVKVN